MRYRTIGSTSLQVSQLCLSAAGGTAALQRALAPALEAGLNFIDAAGARAEAGAGRALRQLGAGAQRFVVTASLPAGPGRVSTAVQDSLARLQRERIDLYRVPAFDAAQPAEVAVPELQALVGQGRIRVVGVSQHAAWQIMQVLGIAAWRRLAQFEFLRTEGADAWVPAEGLGLRAAAPMAKALFSDRYLRESDSDWLPDTGAIQDIAGRRALAPAQAAIAYLLQQPGLCSLVIDPHYLEAALVAAGDSARPAPGRCRAQQRALGAAA